MRKHKNLNKQELMIRQDIPCVHLGGKFVSLKSPQSASGNNGRNVTL